MLLKKGQTILEYVTLFCVVLSALLIMQVYIKRSYQGRIKQEVDNLGASLYSPKHTTSSIETKTATDSVSFTGGKTDANGLPSDLANIVVPGKDISDGMTVTYSSSNTALDRKEAVDSFTAE